MELVTPYRLTPLHQLQSLVEHRNKFSLDFCELNVFETRSQASDFHLKFSGFTITSMLRGKKIMHLDGMKQFDYVPGETVLAPSNTLMRIDFPEAKMKKPTQCTALVIDDFYLSRQLEQINSRLTTEKEVQPLEWKLNFKELILKNNKSLAEITSKILKVFSSDDPFKEYQVDLLLRELVLSMLKLQNLTTVRKESGQDQTQSPFHAVLNYISKHFSSDLKIEELCKVACMSKSSFYRAFTETYGITPGQLILEERIRYAKDLLCDQEISVKEVAFASGFNDPNYFSRLFKKMEGTTPNAFRQKELGYCF